MNKRHPLTVISQLRRYAQAMMTSLSQLKTTISDDFTRELELLSREIEQLDQSSRLLRVRVETKMIETRFTPSDRVTRY